MYVYTVIMCVLMSVCTVDLTKWGFENALEPRHAFRNNKKRQNDILVIFLKNMLRNLLLVCYHGNYLCILR